MTEVAPKFTESEFFVAEPKWRLKAGAPDKLKKEFEQYMNTKGRVEMMKIITGLKNPYYTWQGKIIEK